MNHQLNYLQDELPEYQMHSPDRAFDKTAQYPTLFFLKEDYNILEGAECWLSKTPLEHRSKDWDSVFPRIMSYAWVSSKDFASSIWVAVTHLDHVGKTARHEQAKIIAQWVKGLRGPVILMGDFNDNPDSVVHRLLTSPDTGLKDSWQMLGFEDDASSFTHHDFHGVPRKRRMDWILITPEFRVRGAQIIRDHNGQSYPSDHLPYMADVEVSDQ